MELYKEVMNPSERPSTLTTSQSSPETLSISTSKPERFSFGPQQPRDALKGKLIHKLFQRSASEESGNIKRALDQFAAVGAGAEGALQGPAKLLEEQVEIFRDVYSKAMVVQREGRTVTFVTKPMLGAFRSLSTSS